jgi:hypothetical protein
MHGGLGGWSQFKIGEKLVCFHVAGYMLIATPIIYVRMRGMPSEDFLRISRVRRAFLRWHTVARRKRVRLLALRRLLLRLALRQWLTILRATILADTFRKWVTSTGECIACIMKRKNHN